MLAMVNTRSVARFRTARRTGKATVTAELTSTDEASSGGVEDGPGEGACTGSSWLAALFSGASGIKVMACGVDAGAVCSVVLTGLGLLDVLTAAFISLWNCTRDGELNAVVAVDDGRVRFGVAATLPGGVEKGSVEVGWVGVG